MKASFVFSFLFFLSFLLYFQSCSVEGLCCEPWKKIKPENIPLANPTDEIEVLYLDASLLACNFSQLFSYMDMYHSGIAFVNKNTGYNFTINLEAIPSFEDALIPKIIEHENGTTELKWKNFAAVIIYEGIYSDPMYWILQTKVARMSGSQLNKLISLFHNWNDTHKYYNPWAVYKESLNGTLLLPSYQCFDFAWLVFKAIANFGGTFLEHQANQSILALLSSQDPQKVNTSDPSEWEEIVKFYKKLNEDISSQGLFSFFFDLAKIQFSGKFYLRKDQDYYLVYLKWYSLTPFFTSGFVPVPLP